MKQLAAFIIEDRYFDDFGQICKDHMKHLPKDTDLFVYTSPDHHEKYSEQLKGLNYKFKEYNKNVDVPYSIKYNHIIQQVQQDDRMKALLNMCLFMTEPEFWKDYFDYERVLIFQRDSGILRPGIEEFYEYDYVGAPCYNFVRDQTIQNGGFSLRCPKVMEYICRMYGWKTDLQDLMVVGQYSTASFFAEDIFFCLRMIKYGVGKLAPLEVAKKFSVESKFELGALGYHRLEPYMTEEEVNQIKNQYK